MTVIGFGELFSYEFGPGYTLGNVFVASWVMTACLTIAIVYVWPLVIAPDAENPLSWYYPFTCQCFRKRQVVQND